MTTLTAGLKQDLKVCKNLPKIRWEIKATGSYDTGSKLPALENKQAVAMAACGRIKHWAKTLPLYHTGSAEVKARIRYGQRTQAVPKRGCYTLIWSNSSTNWSVGRSLQKGDTKLDANEILLCGQRAELEAVALALPVLPLYGGSYEAIYKRTGLNGRKRV